MTFHRYLKGDMYNRRLKSFYLLDYIVIKKGAFDTTPSDASNLE
jgi:hypothetical protein